MKFYLIVANGKKKGIPIPIEIDLFLIGSGKACQLRTVHDDLAAQHCALIMRDRKVFVCDLGSGLPTYVNDQMMDPHVEWPLHSGDLLTVGPLKFMVQYREKVLSKKDLEEWALRCLDQHGVQRQSALDRIDEVASHSDEYENAAKAASAIIDVLNAQKGIVRGRLRISREGAITVVRVNDLYLVEDAELALLNRELHENLNRPNLKVLLDLKHVKRMSSPAVEMFDNFVSWLHNQGSRLAICRIRDELKQMLQTYPKTSSLKFFADKQKALSGSW
ncbi:MAG: FHA domain-containing protein [Zavarzinella sp.]